MVLEYIIKGGYDLIFPKVYKVRQKFNTNRLENIPKEIEEQLEIINFKSHISKGMKIAVTAGSRGISNIDLIIKTVCQKLKESDAEPFIVPGMGSHGGATDEGQLNVLKKLGITEKTMEVPIKSSMEVVKIGVTDNKAPVYIDKNAFSSDGIVVINRIKPHTDFSAKHESGLLKMVSVGLGKAKGCSAMHSYGLAETIPKAAAISLEKAPFLFGIAIIENSKDETYKIKAILPQDFFHNDEVLLNEAKALTPKLPVDYLDILIVKEIGKLYSGTCMDTKVIGRMKVFGEVEPEKPVIKKIVALTLDDPTYGNALGIGLADITTQTLVDSIKLDVTYANTIPTTYLERAKIPITLSNDREAIKVALMTIGIVNPLDLKLAIIKNTLQLEELFLTKAAIDSIDKNIIELIDEDGVDMKFNSEGKLLL